jgi:hypothetical protein
LVFEFTHTMPGPPDAPEEVDTLGTVAGAGGVPGEGASAPAEPGDDWVCCPAGGVTFGTVAGEAGFAVSVTGAGRAVGAAPSLEGVEAFGTVAGAFAVGVPYQVCTPWCPLQAPRFEGDDQ